MSSLICTCENSENVVRSCSQCGKECIMEIDFYEKMAKCPKHNYIVDSKQFNYLCEECTNQLCTCEVEGNITETCQQCGKKETRVLDFMERRLKCPIKKHSESIQVCGPFGHLCDKCRKKGYTLKQFPWMDDEEVHD